MRNYIKEIDFVIYILFSFIFSSRLIYIDMFSCDDQTDLTLEYEQTHSLLYFCKIYCMILL